MRFGQLEIDPAKNPAVLDTATWDPAAAWAQVQTLEVSIWQALQAAITEYTPLPASSKIKFYPSSQAAYQGSGYCLVGLADGQQVFLETGPASPHALLGQPLGVLALSSGNHLAAYPTDAATIDRYFQSIRPDKGPRPLGRTPSLGIGTRMTTAVWSGIWQAMAEGNFAANAIQNSVRELNLLEDLLAARPAVKNVAFNFGVIEAGYTGSTYEGLWVAGALAALQSEAAVRYGADADHIQVKRGPDGLARARRLVEAARYYSFFTLDVSDVLDYRALIDEQAVMALPEDQVKALRAYHQRRMGRYAGPGTRLLERLAAKYTLALDAVEQLYRSISALKANARFDLELSIDEHPPEVDTFDCLTTEAELRFVLLEMQRRGIPLTHIAPNAGIEKGVDYRGADGSAGLEARYRALAQVTHELGVMIDVHSGDDLSAATRSAIRRATGGRNHFKISPILQLLFAEVLADYHPTLFRRWWEAARDYARREAAAGSAFAAECLRQSDPDASGELALSVHDNLFHHFSFAFVGQRDSLGQFIRREEFYSLSPDFYRAYQQRVSHYLVDLAAEML